MTNWNVYYRVEGSGRFFLALDDNDSQNLINSYGQLWFRLFHINVDLGEGMGRDPPQYGRKLMNFWIQSSGGAQKSKYKLDHFQLGGVQNFHRTGPCIKPEKPTTI